MKDADLKGIILSREEPFFDDTDLSGADLSGTDLSGIDFIRYVKREDDSYYTKLKLIETHTQVIPSSKPAL